MVLEQIAIKSTTYHDRGNLFVIMFTIGYENFQPSVAMFLLNIYQKISQRL